MSTEQNKQIAIEFMDEVLNGGNLDAADAKGELLRISLMSGIK